MTTAQLVEWALGYVIAIGVAVVVLVTFVLLLLKLRRLAREEDDYATSAPDSVDVNLNGHAVYETRKAQNYWTAQTSLCRHGQWNGRYCVCDKLANTMPTDWDVTTNTECECINSTYSFSSSDPRRCIAPDTLPT